MCDLTIGVVLVTVVGSGIGLLIGLGAITLYEMILGQEEK